MNDEIPVNKSIGKPILVLGLKGAYVAALMAGIGALVILYFTLNIFIDNVVLLVAVALLFIAYYAALKRLNNAYGQHGIEKIIAYKLLQDKIRRKGKKLIK